ncbi:MBL fold metallo-hydrolase [Pseudozobellia sp. WGM2]|uniref:MBL fold metallo-hydrolase n=1 Tax=Pseudozobellia sp. WGM2 TaxID=2787625 RepID=UPI001AE0C77F|nr:MBL fold metallo-hydrolase [Pseudozobellia sp. WGM2]
MILSVIASIIGVLILIAILFINLSPEFGGKIKGEFKERLSKSSNYSDGKFKNLSKTEVMKKTDWGRSSEYFTKGDKVPDFSLPVIKKNKNFLAQNTENKTRLTWFGHSAVLLEIDGNKIFLDPMLGDVPAPHPFLGSKRFNDTLPIAMDNLPELDAVLISHDHYDHLDYGSIKGLKEKVKKFYVPLGVGAHLRSWGVSPDKIIELDWWEEVNFNNLTFVATPSRHFSGRGLFDRYSTLWCSWVIKGSQDNLFFGGDSGYDESFKKIGQKYGPFDIAMLECGQYDAQWPEIHMMPEETVQANVDLNSKVLMPIHWGAFKLGLHNWKEPIERAEKKAEVLNVRLTSPKIGETIILSEKIFPNTKWWKGK